MPKIEYQKIRFSASSRKTIEQASEILEEYVAQGFTLTLRSLYYQFVSRGFIANKQSEYKRLGSIVNDARIAGLIDWDHMEDRTRNLQSIATWNSPQDIINSAARSFKTDLWASQKYRVECWIEKDALVGVIEGVCNELRVPFFSCRGYTSQSEMWSAAQRLLVYKERMKQQPVILHLGDFDPSGIDMSRDIQDRLTMFCWGSRPVFERLALNMDQIDEYEPPPNPAKLTDSRAKSFIEEHGDSSWELDALEPRVIAGLIREAVTRYRNPSSWRKAVAQEEDMKSKLENCSARWSEVSTFLNNGN